MRKIPIVLALLLAAGAVLATQTAPSAYDATSTAQFVILNGEGPASNDDILMDAQFAVVYIYADATEDAVFSLWRLGVSGTDTTWARPSMFTVAGDTVGTVPAGTAVKVELTGADALYISAGAGVLVVE